MRFWLAEIIFKILNATSQKVFYIKQINFLNRAILDSLLETTQILLKKLSQYNSDAPFSSIQNIDSYFTPSHSEEATDFFYDYGVHSQKLETKESK